MNESDPSSTTPSAAQDCEAGATGDLQSQWESISPRLINYMRARLRSKEDALEAAQETWERIVRANDPEALRDLNNFVFKVAPHVATDWLRKGSRRRRLYEKFMAGHQPLAWHTEERSPERTCSADSELAMLERALTPLPLKVRMAWQAKIMGQSPEAIAEQLNCHVRTVRRYLNRADKHLAAALAGQERGAHHHD